MKGGNRPNLRYASAEKYPVVGSSWAEKSFQDILIPDRERIAC